VQLSNHFEAKYFYNPASSVCQILHIVYTRVVLCIAYAFFVVDA